MASDIVSNEVNHDELEEKDEIKISDGQEVTVKVDKEESAEEDK